MLRILDIKTSTRAKTQANIGAAAKAAATAAPRLKAAALSPTAAPPPAAAPPSAVAPPCSNPGAKLNSAAPLHATTVAEALLCNTTDWRVLSAKQAQALLRQLPSLASHACKSEGATSFGQRIVGALLPHVAEHVAIDLLVRRFPEAGAIAGNSVHINDTTMRVRLSCPAQIAPEATVTALKSAVALVNGLTSTDKSAVER